MILKYYNGFVSFDKLSEMLCTNNNGTTAYHIVDVLQSLGFESNGYRYDKISFLKCPCIALIKIDSDNHYVVIYDVNYKKEYLIIGDPAKGIIRMNFDIFMSYWSGISIEMIPVRKIPLEKRFNIYNFLFKFFKNHFNYIFVISFLSLLISLLSVISSFFLQVIITYFKSDFLIYILCFFVFILFFIVLINYIRNIFLIKFNQKIDKSLSLDTFNHIVYLPYYYCKNKTAGEVASYYNDLFLIKDLISSTFSIFIDIPLVILLLFIMFFINSYFFIISLFMLLSYLLIYLIYKRKNSYYLDELLRKKALINSYIVEYVKGFEVIRNLSIQKKIINTFNSKYNNYLEFERKVNKSRVNELLFEEFICNLFTIVTFIYGIFFLKSKFSIDIFITLYFIASLLNSSFKSLLNYYYAIEKVKSSINHVGELFMKCYRKEIVKTDGNICVSNLSYSFDRVNNVLKNVNLEIKIGTKVMVTGNSGSGKSTLFKIVKGYYDNYSGSVKNGKFESRKYDFDNIVYVSSKETLFTGRVADNLNLRYFNKEAVNICELSEFINDYDILIEEDGFNISDGQRQRIVLARALSNFSVLIIDEGLSQVDVNMERRILKRIFNNYRDKTIIYISHRLDNIDLFDRFLKLDNGELVLDEVRSN